MPAVDDFKMQKDHAADRFEHQMWLEEVECWRREHRETHAMLVAAEAAWAKAEAAMDAHVEQIGLHEAHLQRHEKAIHNHQWDLSYLEPDQYPVEHQDLEAIHAKARGDHQRLKEYHDSVMSEFRELLRTALAGAVVPEV